MEFIVDLGVCLTPFRQLYMSVMPTLPLLMAFLCYLPYGLLSLVGLGERAKLRLHDISLKYLIPFYMRIMHGKLFHSIGSIKGISSVE